MLSPSRAGSADHYLEQIRTQMGDTWLPRIYRDHVLKMRTRSYAFPSLSKEAEPQIQHSLLGIELKVGRQRVLCPDLATARYLAVFARVGCRAVAIPYDITKISRLADGLESSLYRMLLLIDDLTGDRSRAFRTRVRRLLIAKVRDEIADAGAGARIPEFRRSTKQA